MQKNTLHLLIIRPGALGDTLVISPILQHLRTLSSQTHITLIGNATVLPLMQAFQLADKVENYEDPFWSRLFMPLTSRHQPQLYARLQHIDRAICWLTDPDNLVKQNLQATGIPITAVVPGRPTVPMPIVSYLAQSIGEPTEAISWRVPAAYAWQREQASETSPRAIAIHPGSGGQKKCWPISHFATIITELLRHCQSYLGNDSGITHLAALLGIPTLVLFGPSDPLIWKPIGPAVTVLKAPNLDTLAPQAVYDQLIAPSVQKNV
jgi:heptosyltransferase-3